jgi:uncharacterized membrane protein YgcG
MKKIKNYMRKNHKGTILMENVIFIILNIFYLGILILFLFRQGSGIVALEQSYAKNIALLIDSAKPIMEMNLNMEDAMKLAEKNGVSREEIVNIQGNIVTVKLTPDGGYQYSFFNKIGISCYPSETGKEYVFIINKEGSGSFCAGGGGGGGAGASGKW